MQGVRVSATSDSLQRYHKEYLERRQAAADRWRDWSSHPWWLEPAARSLLERMQVRLDLSSRRWRDGPASWCAVVDRALVQKVWSIPKLGASDALPLMVIPFRDIPNRLSAAGLVGVGEEGTVSCYRQWLLRPAANHEFGIAYHPSTLEYAGPVLALRDLRCAIWLCLKHMSQAVSWLPLVAWHAGLEGRTRNAWQHWPQWKPVFWGDSLDADLLDQAIRSGGRLYIPSLMRGTYSGTHSSIIIKQLLFWDKPPAYILQVVFRNAKPWQEVAAVWLDALPIGESNTALAQLTQLGHDLGELANHLPPSSRGIIHQFLENHAAGKTARFGRIQVEERESGWFAVQGRSEFLIADCQLRIERAVYYRQSDCIHYEGRILYRGQELPFTASREVLEEQGFDWVRGELIRAGLGVLRYHPDWRAHAVPLALQFHCPHVENGLDAIGWSAQDQCLQLPRYALGRHGEILAPASRHTFADLPGRTLPLPPSTESIDWSALTVDPDLAPLMWGAVACLLAMISAPPSRTRPSGLILAGPGAAIVGSQICDCLGVERVSAVHNIPRLSPHFWPRWLTLDRHRRPGRLTSWLAEGPPWCVVPLSWRHGVALAWHGGWHLLEGRRPLCLPARTVQVLPSVVACYLERLAQTQWVLPVESLSHAGDVLHDLNRWFQAMRLSLTPLRAVECLYQDSTVSRAALLIRILEKLHFEGGGRQDPVLSIGRNVIRARKAAITLWQEPFQSACLSLSEDLRACQALHSEDAQHWHFDARWWADVSPHPERIERALCALQDDDSDRLLSGRPHV